MIVGQQTRNCKICKKNIEESGGIEKIIHGLVSNSVKIKHRTGNKLKNVNTKGKKNTEMLRKFARQQKKTNVHANPNELVSPNQSRLERRSSLQVQACSASICMQWAICRFTFVSQGKQPLKQRSISFHAEHSVAVAHKYS